MCASTLNLSAAFNTSFRSSFVPMRTNAKITTEIITKPFLGKYLTWSILIKILSLKTIMGRWHSNIGRSLVSDYSVDKLLIMRGPSITGRSWLSRKQSWIGFIFLCIVSVVCWIHIIVMRGSVSPPVGAAPADYFDWLFIRSNSRAWNLLLCHCSNLPGRSIYDHNVPANGPPD